MFRTFVLLIVVLVATRDSQAAGDTKDDKAKQELKSLQGIWDVKSCVYDGKPADKSFYDGIALIVKDDTFTAIIQRNGKELSRVEGSIAVDPAKSPKIMDLRHKKPDTRTELAIYELKGDKLSIALHSSGSKRPSELASKPESGVFLYVYQRRAK